MDDPALNAEAAIEVYVNDVAVSGPFGARFRRGHVWVPVREVVEILGGESHLRISTRTITLRFGDRQTKLSLDDPRRAVLLGSTPMAQAEALAALLGVEYQWDEERRRALLRGQTAAGPAPDGAVSPAQTGVFDLTLSDLAGAPLPLSRLADRPAVLFVWGSWSESRDRLSEWQGFYSRHRDLGFRLLAVAIDAAGGEVAKPYVDRARLGRRTAVDERNLLGERLGFKSVPKVFLVDQGGIAAEAEDDQQRIVRWLQGARRADRPRGAKAEVSPRESPQVIEKRLRAEPDNPALRLQLGDALADKGDWNRAARQYRRATEVSSPSPIALYRLGVALLKRGKSRQAAACWRRAMKIEPDNEIIRKQVWAVESPDRFYQGDIDLDWQRQQDRRRRRRR